MVRFDCIIFFKHINMLKLVFATNNQNKIERVKKSKSYVH